MATSEPQAACSIRKARRHTPGTSRSGLHHDLLDGAINMEPIKLEALRESLAIASKHNLYAYDAYLIACAQSERCKLISLDAALLGAATASGVAIVEVP